METISAAAAAAAGGTAAMVVNRGAFTHSSLALRATAAAPGVRIGDVHLPDRHARGRVRHQLTMAPAARGVIAGLGLLSYELGLHAVATLALTPAGP